MWHELIVERDENRIEFIKQQLIHLETLPNAIEKDKLKESLNIRMNEIETLILKDETLTGTYNTKSYLYFYFVIFTQLKNQKSLFWQSCLFVFFDVWLNSFLFYFYPTDRFTIKPIIRFR